MGEEAVVGASWGWLGMRLGMAGRLGKAIRRRGTGEGLGERGDG